MCRRSPVLSFGAVVSPARVAAILWSCVVDTVSGFEVLSGSRDDSPRPPIEPPLNLTLAQSSNEVSVLSAKSWLIDADTGSLIDPLQFQSIPPEPKVNGRGMVEPGQ